MINSRPARGAITLAIAAIAVLSACGEKARPRVETGQAPDSFRVALETNRGRITIQVNRAWAPLGADRFHELVANEFFDQNRFFRVLPNFIAQFGINDKKKVNEEWGDRRIADDPRIQSNTRGTLSFANLGPGTRAHQPFINLKDNPNLDADGFTPFGRVIEGMALVDSLYDEYGDTPKQHLVSTLGNTYLQRMFPKLDYIITARIVP